jgi:HAD superfamily hydrolase (TIGR01509 family)
MSDNGIRLICFDAGGVLVRICRTWEDGCAAAGLPFRERDHSEPASSRRRDLHRSYQCGLIDGASYHAGLAATSAGAYTPDEVRLVHDAWILGEYDGARQLVADLHDAGLVTGVLSNTNESHWSIMGPQRSTVVFDVHHPHASHLLGHVKPDEKIFRAFEAATAHGPSQILFFDDLADNVEAAKAAGWHAHQVDHEGDPPGDMRAHLAYLGLI